MNKTRLLIIILILAAIFGALWYFVFKEGPADPEVETGTQDPNLFPFTAGDGNIPASTEGLTPEEIQQIIELSDRTEDEVRLTKVWADPQAGASFVSRATSSPKLRFVDSATGHIYDAEQGKEPEKISNVTIPQIKEALWGRDGKNLVLRYLKEDSSVQSFSATVSTSSISTAISGTFLPANIKAIGVSDNKVLYVNPGKVSGNIYLADISGKRRSEVFNSSFSDWAVSFENQKNAFIYTKPSGLSTGSGFILDLTRSTATKISAEGYGLEGTISPSGNHVFLSYTDGSIIKSSVYSLVKKTYVDIGPGTLASKCAWSQVDSSAIYCAIPKNPNPGTYPDDWYKGLVSFTDSIWKIDVETGEMELLLDPVLEGQLFDVSDLVVGPQDKELAITNKKDLSLWLYTLKD
jgi:hypothetical protein